MKYILFKKINNKLLPSILDLKFMLNKIETNNIFNNKKSIYYYFFDKY